MPWQMSLLLSLQCAECRYRQVFLSTRLAPSPSLSPPTCPRLAGSRRRARFTGSRLFIQAVPNDDDLSQDHHSSTSSIIVRDRGRRDRVRGYRTRSRPPPVNIPESATTPPQSLVRIRMTVGTKNAIVTKCFRIRQVS